MTGFDYGERRPDGQHERHPHLPEDSPLPFVRPVRVLAETYARVPHYYGRTFCSRCRDYFPVGAQGEFLWIEEDGRLGPKVGT